MRLQAGELTQVVLGFAVPILLAHHVVATRISDSFFGTYDLYYTYFLWIYFVHSPEHGALQMLTLVVAWTHAMFGLHFWLRVRPWYARVQPAALVVAVLVPVLSLLGAIEAGRQVAALAADPAWSRDGVRPYAAAVARRHRARARSDQRHSRAGSSPAWSVRYWWRASCAGYGSAATG